MARPSVVVVCSNVAQSGRITQGLGTRGGQQGSGQDHTLNGPASTRHGRERSGHPHDRSGPRITGHGHEGSTPHHHHQSGSHPTTGTRARARSATAARVWKVFDGKTLHEVQDFGTRLEATSEHGGGTVWTGVRLPSGGYDTWSTTLPVHKLASFLRMVHDGDQTTAGAQEVPARAEHAAPPSGPRVAQRAPVARARKAATEAPPKAPHAAQKQSKPKKPKSPASAQPKSKTPKSAPPKSKTPKSKPPTSAPPKSKAKAKAKRQAAAQTRAHGPSTSRSPGSQYETPTSMRRLLLARDPDVDEEDLTMLEDMWRAGASVPTRAWMIAKGITDSADGFIKWLDHHKEEASEYMDAAKALRAA
jgi:hypothetical protein